VIFFLVQHENPFTAAYQLFEQNQENLQISSEASQNDKTNVAEPTSLGKILFDFTLRLLRI